MKQLLLIIIATLFIAVACDDKQPARPPGEAKTDEKPIDRLAALKVLPPKIKGCVTSTPDYVVTGSETTVSGDEHCFPSDGTGGFGPRMDIPGLSQVDGMDVADMDGDGDNDFLVCDGSIGVAYLFTQEPANLFVPTVAASGITSGADGSLFCTNLRIADFNEDGLNDFVVGDNRVSKGMFIYRQGPVGTFNKIVSGLDVSWASPTGASCNCLFGVAAGDVDGDGHQDVLVLGYRGVSAGHLYFYKGDGAGGMAAPVLKFNVSAHFPIVQTPTGLALFDLESDGDLDVVIGGSDDGSHYVYKNSGTGTFTVPVGPPAFDVNNYTGIDAYDVNSDGFDDVVLVDWSSRRLVYLQNSAGTLTAPASVNSVKGDSIGIGAPELIATPSQALDHFKCYTTEAKPVDKGVILEDQFGKGEAQVLDPVKFCNPVQKTHKDKVIPIRHRDHHLKFYRIETKDPDVTRVVYVDNQFGRQQQLVLTRPLFLAVPTQKLYPGEHPPPRALDHFKCYQAEGEPVQAMVDLKDQFNYESQVKVYKPFVLCNPAEKKFATHENPIYYPNAHLMCYLMEPRPYETKVKTRNQFGEEELPILEADMLCLPSGKKTQIAGIPLITHIGHISLLNINGGNVPVGGPGTGLASAFSFDRPFGRWIAVHGDITAGVHEYRIVYRQAGTPRPAPASAVGVAVIPAVGWLSEDWTGGSCSLLPVTPVASNADGWFNAAEYRRMAEGEGVPFNHVCSNNLALTVWNSQTAIPDTEGHYVIWLQWRNVPMGPIFEEVFDHHVQLDNKAPENLSLNIPGGACATYGAADMPIMVQGHIDDAHFWRYHFRVFGGNPPDAHNYGWVNYNDAGPEAANVGPTGTLGVGNVDLRQVDVNDMVPPPLVKCAYGLRLRAEDRTIHGDFDPGNNLLPWGLGLESIKEITFDYTP